jgi:hypothetical protein
MMKRRWSDLSDRTRKLIIVVGVAETALKVAMLVDLKRRDGREIRGPKGLWAATALVNSAGVLPLVYFGFGRNPSAG